MTRRWGNRVAIDDVSLSIQPNEKVALVGPSGGGKSTLIRLLAGVLKPTSGRIYVDGQDLASFSARQLREHRKCCSIVEQSNLLVPQLSVHQNVIAGKLAHWHWSRSVLAFLWPLEQHSVGSLLQALGIHEYQWELASRLSGGQMQRVAVARALISEPLIVLADEPTASLDPANAKSVTRLILEQAQARNSTLIFCTHWIDLVMAECDRVIGLREGAITLNCPPSRINDADLAKLYEGSDERI